MAKLTTNDGRVFVHNGKVQVGGSICTCVCVDAGGCSGCYRLESTLCSSADDASPALQSACAPRYWLVDAFSGAVTADCKSQSRFSGSVSKPFCITGGGVEWSGAGRTGAFRTIYSLADCNGDAGTPIEIDVSGGLETRVNGSDVEARLRMVTNAFGTSAEFLFDSGWVVVTGLFCATGNQIVFTNTLGELRATVGTLGINTLEPGAALGDHLQYVTPPATARITSCSSACADTRCPKPCFNRYCLRFTFDNGVDPPTEIQRNVDRIQTARWIDADPDYTLNLNCLVQDDVPSWRAIFSDDRGSPTLPDVTFISDPIAADQCPESAIFAPQNVGGFDVTVEVIPGPCVTEPVCFVLGTGSGSHVAEADGDFTIYANDEGLGSLGDNSGSFSVDIGINGGAKTTYTVNGADGFEITITVAAGDLIQYENGTGTVIVSGAGSEYDPDGVLVAGPGEVPGAPLFCPGLIPYGLVGKVVV